MLYSVILPTYNERENLPIVFYLLFQAFQKLPHHELEIIIVDDASPDGTLQIAKQLQSSSFLSEDSSNVTIKILSRKGKLGLGTAYIAGLELSEGERVVLMDADLSHHPKYIVKMIDVMNESNVDIVSGTRYRRGGGVAGWNWYRKLTSRTANFLASFLLNTGDASDLTGSFRLYKKVALQKILPLVQSKGYAFQMEILVLAKNANLTLGEVPITFVDRIYGKSKLGTQEIYMYLKGLIKLFFTT